MLSPSFPTIVEAEAVEPANGGGFQTMSADCRCSPVFPAPSPQVGGVCPVPGLVNTPTLMNHQPPSGLRCVSSAQNVTVSTIGCDGGCGGWSPLTEAGSSRSETGGLTAWGCPSCIAAPAAATSVKTEMVTQETAPWSNDQESDLRRLQKAVKGRGLSAEIVPQAASLSTSADPWPVHILGLKTSSSEPGDPCADLPPGKLHVPPLDPNVNDREPDRQPGQVLVPCRTISSANILLPDLEAGNPFAVNIEGVSEPVVVTFPPEAVAGAMHNFELKRPVTQWDIPAAECSAAVLYGADRMKISDSLSRDIVSTIGCDGGCNQWIPLADAGLSQSEAAALISWSCPACINTPTAEAAEQDPVAATAKVKQEITGAMWTPADDALLRSIHPEHQTGGDWDQCAAAFNAKAGPARRQRTASSILNRHYVLKNGSSYDDLRKAGTPASTARSSTAKVKKENQSVETAALPACVNTRTASAGSSPGFVSNWAAAEDQSLRLIVNASNGDSGWAVKAAAFNTLGGRQVTGDSLHHRWALIAGSGAEAAATEAAEQERYDDLRKAAEANASRSAAGKSHPWTQTEDTDLTALVHMHGGGNWDYKAEAFFKMPGHTDALRTAKSLSCRWTILAKGGSTVGCDGGCNKWIPLSQTGMSQSEADALSIWSCKACVKKNPAKAKVAAEPKPNLDVGKDISGKQWTADEDQTVWMIAKRDGGWQVKVAAFNALGGRQVKADTLRHRWDMLTDKDAPALQPVPSASCAACQGQHRAHVCAKGAMFQDNFVHKPRQYMYSAAEQQAGLTVGSRVRCLYPADGDRYPATIMRVSTDGTTAVVKWDDGDTEFTKRPMREVWPLESGIRNERRLVNSIGNQAWTEIEDRHLRELIERDGPGDWLHMAPKFNAMKGHACERSIK